MAANVTGSGPIFNPVGPQQSKADKKDEYVLNQAGNYPINLNDGNSDRVDIQTKNGIHADIGTDYGDVVMLDGWEETARDAEGNRKYINKEDPNSIVTVTGDGAVVTDSGDLRQMAEAVKRDKPTSAAPTKEENNMPSKPPLDEAARQALFDSIKKQ